MRAVGTYRAPTGEKATLAQAVAETHAEIRLASLTAPIVGHVSHGDFHMMFSVDPDDDDEIGRVRGLDGRLVNRAILHGGICTGEYRIGTGKREKLLAELGPGRSP